MNFDRDEIIRRARIIFYGGRMIHERIVRAQADLLADLSLAQYRCLLAIRLNSGLSISELARYLGVSPASASAMVDRLVEKGVLKRRRGAKDRRKVKVELTRDAENLVDRIEDQIVEVFAEIVEKLGPETSLAWCRVVGTIRSCLEPGGSLYDRSKGADDEKRAK